MQHQRRFFNKKWKHCREWQSIGLVLYFFLKVGPNRRSFILLISIIFTLHTSNTIHTSWGIRKPLYRGIAWLPFRKYLNQKIQVLFTPVSKTAKGCLRSVGLNILELQSRWNIVLKHWKRWFWWANSLGCTHLLVKIHYTFVSKKSI